MEIIPMPHDHNANMTSACKRILKIIKILLLMFLVMIFMIYFTSSTVLLGANKAEYVLLSKPTILENPVTALLMGLLVSSVIHSQGICLSIFTTMVSTNIISVELTVPLIMGMNIGSSITPFLVSLPLAYNRESFSRVTTNILSTHFVHWLTAAVLLPLELATGVLFLVSQKLFPVDYPVFNTYQDYGFLNGILKPLSGYIVKVSFNDSTNDSSNTTMVIDESIECTGWMHDAGLSPFIIGMVCLVISVFVIPILIVLIGKSASTEESSFYSLSNDYSEERCGYLKGFCFVFVGAVVTMVVQDSTLIQCAILPVIGVSFFRTEKVFPVLIGSNVGGAVAILLGAITDPWDSSVALQIIFCHVVFNVCGFIFFYCLPFSATVPIVLAEYVGNRTREYRWILIVFITMVFYCIPLTTFGFALAGPHFVITFLSLIIFLILIVTTVNMMQTFCPSCLLPSMRSWDFLPSGLRSLELYDGYVVKMMNASERITCSKTHTISFPNESNIDESPRPATPKDIHIIVPEEKSCCCRPWFVSGSFYKRYILSVPPTTSTPKVVQVQSRTPVLVGFKQETECELINCSYTQYDPREALNFGTLGFDEDSLSSDSEMSEDPSDFTTSTSSSSYASTSDDGQLLLYNAY